MRGPEEFGRLVGLAAAVLFALLLALVAVLGQERTARSPAPVVDTPVSCPGGVAGC